MKISGANLEDMEVSYKSLSDYNWSNKEEIMKLISMIEKMYNSFLNREDEINVKPFPTDDNNHVVIEAGMLNHRCSADLEVLRNLSKYGILASEWFGVLESEREACFCAFLSRMKGHDYPYKGDLAEDNRSRLNVGHNVLLFFDEENEIMQKLLHLDYFEYESIKEKHPEKLTEVYTPEEIELFDKLIEPISPAGKDMRKERDFKTNYWSAVPGGIPSFLVNGICIKNNDYSPEEIEEISKLFPNATIFKSDLEIVHLPVKNKEDNKII